MDNFGTPANSNTSFTQLTRNPARELAIANIDQVTDLLARADVPRSVIVEVLFDRLTKLIVPEGDLTAENATTWYAQLQRMRDSLQDQINLIETELDRTRNT